MRTNLSLELADVPGKLVNVLEPISELGANLVTIIHERDSKTDEGMIPVQITLEGEKENLNKVIEKLKELEVTILKIDNVILKENLRTLLIGHVVDNDVKDIMDKINSINGANVVDMEVRLVEDDIGSAAMFVIQVDHGLIPKVNNKVQEICNEKKLLMVNEV
ncbi:MAG: amino acid-binding protein [Methanobacteriaceae archaeon]